jgi:chromosome segregation ATPase
VSVSPDDADRERSKGSNGPLTRKPSESTLITPRVLDQEAFDQLASTLRSLLDEAGNAVDRLESRIEAAERREDAPSSAAAQLQERLRLSAQMLKAFQSQIDRVQTVITEIVERRLGLDDTAVALVRTIDSRRAGAVTEIEVTAAAAVESFEKRWSDDAAGQARLAAFETQLESRAEAVITRFQSRIETHESERLARMEDASERLAGLEQRVAAMEQTVETAEVTVAALGHRVGEAGRLASAHLENAESATAHCGEMIDSLNDTVDAASEQVEQLTSQGERLTAAVRERMDRGDVAERRLAGRVTEAERALGQIEPTADRCDTLRADLDRIIDRLGPWEKLLVDAECDENGTPRPVTQMLDHLREGIGHDVAQLGSTLRTLVARIEHIGAPATDTTPAGKPKTQEIVRFIERPKDQMTPPDTLAAEPKLRFQDHIE